MENNELIDLHNVYKELFSDAAKISEAVLDQTQNLLSIERVYSYMAKVTWIVTLIFSGVVLFLAITSSVPVNLVGPILIWIFLVSLGIFGYKRKDSFQDLIEVFQDVWNFHYRVTWENATVTGADPTERAFNKLKIAFPELDEYSRKKPKAVEINAKVMGKTGEHDFDIYVHVKQDLLSRLTLGQFGEPGYYLILRRFTKKEPITERELAQLRSEIVDIHASTKFTRKAIDRIIVISPSSFTDGAIEYAKKGNNWIPSISLEKGKEPSVDNYLAEAADLQIEFCTFDLIKESGEKHKVVWAL